MTLDEFLSLLDNAKKSGRGFVAKCPAHEDRTASLSVTAKEGRILLKCHAGCEAKSVVATLRITFNDLCIDATSSYTSNNSKIGERKEVYPYTDEEGRELFAVLRYEKTEGGERVKTFRQGVKDSNHRDGYKWGVQGVRRVLFRLPQVLKAKEAGETIYLVEGEKDCLNLAKWGLCATTNPMGAGKWLSEYTEALTGADVVIIPDNDKAGQEHMVTVGALLKGKAQRLRVLLLPDLQEKGDVSDWIASGGTSEKLAILLQTAPEYADMEAHFSLISENYHFQHSTDIHIKADYECFTAWEKAIEEMARNGFDYRKKESLAWAKLYNATIKNMGYGNKRKTLKKYTGNHARNIENLASALNAFAQDNVLVPERMPTSFIKTLAPIPHEAKQEAVTLYQNRQIKSGNDLNTFLGNKGLLPKKQEPEGFKYLQGCVPNTQAVALANDVKQHGSQDLREMNNLYLSLDPDTRKEMIALMQLLKGLQDVRGEQTAKSASALFKQVLTQAMVTGEILFPDADRIEVEDLTDPESDALSKQEHDDQYILNTDHTFEPQFSLKSEKVKIEEADPPPLECDLLTSEEYHRLQEALPYIPKEAETLRYEVSLVLP